MKQLVTYEIHNNIAVIILDNPPVNAFSHPVRVLIGGYLQQAHEDKAVHAVVITAAGNLFTGGADITEFDTGTMWASPNPSELCKRVEDSGKPVIVAMNGSAMGGGLELALAADYRIAAANARLGLPEVKLGVIPGAGGTQRLPRLVGPQFALDMIVSGKPVTAEQGRAAGLIDRVSEGDKDFIASAVAYARELVDANAPRRQCADMCVDLTGLPENFFTEYRASIARKTRGFFAPERCVEAIEAACRLPLVEGLEAELALAKECLETPHSRAQRHLFFAERAVTRVPGIDPETRPRRIERVAIIGAGTMGGGIAMNFANAGLPVTLLDVTREALDRGLGVIRRNYDRSARKGRLTAQQVEERMDLLATTVRYEDLADAGMVIEAVFENMDIKKKVFGRLETVCKPGAILATNTSTLDVDEIALSTGRPEDVLGLHFFSPANVMRLLEVVRGARTAPEVIVTALKLAKQIGKVPVVVGVCFGFVGNRMLQPYLREAWRLLIEGASPAQVDKALTGFGMAMGPLAMTDLAGIDIGYQVRESRREAIGHDPSYARVPDKLYELGRYGQKTGRGFYLYEDRERKEDPEVIELAQEIAAELDVVRREITNEEIVERCIYMLINEGANVLDDGIACRSGDCDIVWTNGYGFPVWRGGPMHYADEIGLDVVLDTINRYHDRLGGHGEMWFKPSPLLEKLAAEGESFAGWQSA